jgi:hypothetical protein
VLVAARGSAPLDVLARHEFAVIVTDYRMQIESSCSGTARNSFPRQCGSC